jgi:hypothetical protein
MGVGWSAAAALWNKALDATAGTLFEAATGNVSPWKLEAIKRENEVIQRRALQQSGRPQEEIEAEIARNREEIDRYVKSIDAHPDDASLRILGAKFDAKDFALGLQWLVLLVGVGGVLYFGAKFIQAVRGKGP